MTPVKQEQDNDCLRACVATILDLPLADVLHFCDGEHETNGQWLPRLIDWCASRNVGVVYCRMEHSPLILAGARGIFTGKTPDGDWHSVVGRGEWVRNEPSEAEGNNTGVWQMVGEHDPSPYQPGLESVSNVIFLVPGVE